jgi:hypothetical protein
MLLSHSAVTQTLIAANLPDSLWRVAADLLARAGASGACALPLVELGDPAQALDALQQLRDRGLLVVDVVGVEVGGDPARAWVVAWLPAFAGVGAAVTRRGVTGNVSSDGVCLFVCSDPLDGDLNIKTNKQTARACTHAYAREGEGAPAAVAADVAAVSAPVVTGNITSDKARIAALLSDPAVTRGLVVNGGAAVGALPADKARALAVELTAAGRDFDFVLANVCEWRRQVEQGKVFSPLPALVARLRRGFAGSITAADRGEAWFVHHAPPVLPWPALPVEVGGVDDGAAVSAAVVTGNITSDGGPAGAASAWDRFVASLAAQGEARFADVLEGSSAVEQGDVWIVRLAGRGSAWVDWLRDRAGRRLADWFGREIGRPVVLEFAQAGGND